MLLLFSHILAINHTFYCCVLINKAINKAYANQQDIYEHLKAVQ